MLFNVTTFLDSIIINCLNKKLEDFSKIQIITCYRSSNNDKVHINVKENKSLIIVIHLPHNFLP